MNLHVPPQEKLRPDTSEDNLRALHSNFDTRIHFYKTYLFPVGHAAFTRYGLAFSEEFLLAVKTELPFFQAMLKLIL